MRLKERWLSVSLDALAGCLYVWMLTPVTHDGGCGCGQLFEDDLSKEKSLSRSNARTTFAAGGSSEAGRRFAAEKDKRA